MKTRVRMAGYQGASSVHTRALQAMAERLDGGGFQPEVTPDITVLQRRADDLLSLTEQGDLEICYFAASYLQSRVAAVELLDLPFLIADRADGHAFFDGPLCAELRRMLEASSGYRVLGWWDNGFRHLSSAKCAIRSPADCAGQRIRTMGDAPQHHPVFEAMGFIPVPLDVRELMPAIRRGTVDAQENPLTNVWNFEIYNYHRWTTLTGHFFGPTLLLCNAGFYARLGEKERRVVDLTAQEATILQRDFAAAADGSASRSLRKAGNELITLSDAELAEFKQAVRPVADAMRARHAAAITSLLPS